MKFSDSLKVSFGDLKKRKGRTFLTSLAVAIGVTLIMTMVGLGTSFEGYLMNMLQQQTDATIIQVMPSKYFEKQPKFKTENDYNKYLTKMYHKLDDNALMKFNKIHGINDVQAEIGLKVNTVQLNGKAVGTSNMQIYGCNTKYKVFSDTIIQKKRKQNGNADLKAITFGKNLNSSDKNKVIIAEDLLKTFGIKDYKSAVGKDLLITCNTSENGLVKLKPMVIKLKVAGVINSKLSDYKGNIVLPIDVANQLKSYSTLKSNYLKEKGYDYVILHTKDETTLNSAILKINKLNYISYSRAEIAKKISGYFVIIKRALAILGLIVLFIAALGIINTMIMSINERTKSIGIMKSVGASSSDINKIFIVESGAIGFIGGIIGLLFTSLNVQIIQAIINSLLKSSNNTETMSVSVPLWLTAGCMCFAICVAVLSGLYPANKASKLDPVNALNSR